jgi:hypothetical protein
MNIDKRLENLSEEIENLIDQKTEEELSREKLVIIM